MKTALVILNYSNFSDTCNCIESVLQYNTAPVKFIVVDNGSTEDEKKKVADYVQSLASAGVECAMVQSAENLGYAKGNNLGLKVAAADDEIDRVAILNNDILLVDDILPRLIDLQDSIDDCAVISPVLYKAGLSEVDGNCARNRKSAFDISVGNFLHYYYRLSGKRKRELIDLDCVETTAEVMKIGVPSGAFMLMKKDVAERLGGFDPNTFLYFEEDILAEKVNREGLSCYLALQLKCVHLGASTTGKMPMSVSRMKMLLRSQRYYVTNYLGAGRFMRALHWLSLRFFLLAFCVQKSLGLRLKR